MVLRKVPTDRLLLVERALADIRRGRMVILTDDESRENEGDLVMAAEKVTAKAVNFMATHGRGLICLSLTEERLARLQLPLMVQDNRSPFQTAFTVSIEAAAGVTTGISAADRAHTIKTAVSPDARPEDLVRPGHVFPLRCREGGVLVRTGQTEGSVDLARLAGLYPAGVLCEIMNPDGTMARRPELVRFARRHALTMLSVADLIRYRLARERLVERVSEAGVRRDDFGAFTAYAYRSHVDEAVHLALVKGDVRRGGPVLTRVHRVCLSGDVLGDVGCECQAHLRQAMQRITEEGRGVVVLLRKLRPPESALACIQLSSTATDEARLRELGVGAQILKDLGLSRLRLLTTSPKTLVGLESYDIQVTEQVPLSGAAVSQRTRSPARRRAK